MNDISLLLVASFMQNTRWNDTTESNMTTTPSCHTTWSSLLLAIKQHKQLHTTYTSN